MKFKVTPINTKTLSEAPSIVVEVSENVTDPKHEAVEMAKKKTRLSNFPQWDFAVTQI